MSAQSDADALRRSANTLSAQLEEAWKQVEEAHPTDDEATMFDALTELAAKPADHEVSVTPPAPDPEDPDARLAALGYLNSLARDLPRSRRPGT